MQTAAVSFCGAAEKLWLIPSAFTGTFPVSAAY
jgi:hypothetical protein